MCPFGSAVTPKDMNRREMSSHSEIYNFTEVPYSYLRCLSCLSTSHLLKELTKSSRETLHVALHLCDVHFLLMTARRKEIAVPAVGMQDMAVRVIKIIF